jgi:predicted amidophosphoribosyltransferase
MGFDFTPYPLICAVCDTHVSQQAKHCGICNRCVDRFDHHCKWLNNCVGQQNYMTFFRLIICVFAMTLMHNITNLAVLISFYTET